MRRMGWAIGLAGAMVPVSCGLTEVDLPRALLEVTVPRLDLTVRDTLVIRRTITNVSYYPIWVSVSSSDAGFHAIDVAGRAACGIGLTTAELATRRVDANSRLTLERRFTVGNLTGCPPGTYRLFVSARIATSRDGSWPAYLLQGTEQALTVRP